MTRLVTYFCLAGCLTGCGAPVAIMDYYDTDTETLRRFSHMAIIDAGDLQAGGYKKIGNVTGIYCQKGTQQTDKQDRFEAIDQVKLKAARRGATHISTPSCTVSGLDMANNCFHTVVCKADAVTKD